MMYKGDYALSLIALIKKKINETGYTWADLFGAFCAAFVIASAVFVLGNDFQNLAHVHSYSIVLPAIICICITALLSGLSLFVFGNSRVQKGVLLVACLFLCAALVVGYSKDVFFCLGLAFVLVLVIKYAVGLENEGEIQILKRFDDKHSLIVVSVLVAAFTAGVFAMTAAKYATFGHSTFDFGIFACMFENMAETGLPNTTVERGKELSHFAVHFSPFYYVLLPGYMLWRSPLYLLLVQALGIALGAFAVRRICRALQLSPSMATAFAALYLLFPSMSNGCFFDFHENKFLSVLILWSLVFILEENRIGTAVFFLLILTVKEDAFIYVITICIWMFVTKRDRLFAVIGAVASFFWFLFACQMIRVCGGEIMSDRFANYSVEKDAGLFGAVRTCFIDIGYLIKEVFAGAATDRFKELTYSGQKLEFIWWLFVPLLFAPFLRKRSSELVLLIPLLVINLMPEWRYQFNVGYQYTYGTAALLIFSAIMYVKEASPRVRRFLVTSMVCISMVFMISLVWNRAGGYFSEYSENKTKYDMTVEALEMIPEDATVTAYGCMVPHLWQVDVLQTVPKHYGQLVPTEYFVIDKRYETSGNILDMYHCMGNDYDLICDKGYVKIFKVKGSD